MPNQRVRASTDTACSTPVDAAMLEGTLVAAIVYGLELALSFQCARDLTLLGLRTRKRIHVFLFLYVFFLVLLATLHIVSTVSITTTAFVYAGKSRVSAAVYAESLDSRSIGKLSSSAALILSFLSNGLMVSSFLYLTIF